MGLGSTEVRHRIRTWPEQGPREAVLTQYRPLYPHEGEASYQTRMADYLEELGGGLACIRRHPKVKQSIFGFRAEKLWRLWGQLQLPVLVVRGSRTQMLTMGIVEKMHETHGHLEFVELEGVDHNIPSEAPRELASALERCWRRRAFRRSKG